MVRVYTLMLAFPGKNMFMSVCITSEDSNVPVCESCMQFCNSPGLFYAPTVCVGPILYYFQDDQMYQMCQGNPVRNNLFADPGLHVLSQLQFFLSMWCGCCERLFCILTCICMTCIIYMCSSFHPCMHLCIWTWHLFLATLNQRYGAIHAHIFSKGRTDRWINECD